MHEWLRYIVVRSIHVCKNQELSLWCREGEFEVRLSARENPLRFLTGSQQTLQGVCCRLREHPSRWTLNGVQCRANNITLLCPGKPFAIPLLFSQEQAKPLHLPCFRLLFTDLLTGFLKAAFSEKSLGPFSSSRSGSIDGALEELVSWASMPSRG